MNSLVPDSVPDSAIGVFDSGVGGLTVLRAIRAQLSTENLLYVADSQHMPYGERDPEYIVKRCVAVAHFLRRQPVKAIVVACNTASVVTIQTLRDQIDVPIVGIEPAIKPATSVTRSGVVGVMATSRTVESPGVKKLCNLYGQNVEIILTPCAGLVECIERAELNTPSTRALLNSFITPMLSAGADTIVLGCTHYPFVRDVIQDIVGNTVTIIEPGAAVARQLARRLDELDVHRSNTASDESGSETFFSTGEIGDVAGVISSLWGRPISVRYLEGI